ncbi:hypothetical protein PHMEG_00031444 [Phytophthora megakarya]|uniref:M96 mating-specific protein n=1 Tax=Phytophthora megakarya TaxID=4795 RepID=A0A225UYA8_9STRA|nr:hypothetical protein PHMEG_00031444 [Phytophthora megakarya]
MDDAATLSEVLSLLEAIDSHDSDSSSTDLSQGAIPSVVQRSPQLKTLKTKKDHRRKEGPVRYTTSLQRRKKEELKTLRNEAKRLNAQLEQLQQNRLSNIGSASALIPQDSQDSNPNGWRRLATIESEGRERSERTNRELKSIMAHQMKVHAAIAKILGRSKLLEGMNFVFQLQPSLDRPLHQLDFSDSILAELSNSLGSLRLQTNGVFPPLEDDVSIACISRSKHHESVGKSIETTSITPMACSVQKAAEILWHHITTKKNKDIQKAFRFIRTRNDNSLERNCMASLPDGKNLLINLDGVNIVRGLQFEDHHWTIISPSPTDPIHASVVQSCYQLQVKRVDSASVLPLDFAHVEQVVLNSIGKKLRNVLQLQQNVLLENDAANNVR